MGQEAPLQRPGHIGPGPVQAGVGDGHAGASGQVLDEGHVGRPEPAPGAGHAEDQHAHDVVLRLQGYGHP